MSNSYSVDLRQRVLLACEQREGTRSQIAQRFRVSERTVYGWLKLARCEQRAAPLPDRGGGEMLAGIGLPILAALVEEDNDATLAEYAERLERRTGLRFSTTSICRALQQLNLKRKKKTLRPREWDLEAVARERAAFSAEIAEIDPTRVIVLDESGVKTTITRSHARAPVGQRACGSVPFGTWSVVTVLCALSVNGILATMTINTATSARVFLAFVEQILIPTLIRDCPGVTVMLDNLSAHKNSAVRAAFAAAGIPVRYLPRYSPDLNPLEMGWEKMKADLRGAEPRTVEAIETAVPLALDRITASDAQAWFAHCGFAQAYAN